MRAIVYTKYGNPDVLELKEMGKPDPEDDEVLVRICATSVSPIDWHFRSGDSMIGRIMSGLFKPKFNILGFEMSGIIESKGNNVKLFDIGDQVFGGKLGGAHAEYISISEENVVAKPSNMTFEEAAGVTICGFAALQFLRDFGKIKTGHKVLINGASGGVGTMAIQLAKYFDTEVTAVCSSQNLELVKSLGADHVIDYSKEEFTDAGKEYDIIFDAVGKNSFTNCKKVLSENGKYISTVASLRLILQMLWTSITGGKKAIFAVNKHSVDDLNFLRELIEVGKLKIVLDKKYSLDQIAEAHHYSEKGHAKGKVIVSIQDPE